MSIAPAPKHGGHKHKHSAKDHHLPADGRVNGDDEGTAVASSLADTSVSLMVPASLATADAIAPTAKEKQQAIYDSFGKGNLRWNNIDWTVFVWITAMHIGALAAPFYFTWQALGVAVVLHWFTGSIGICLGYHRFLAHSSLKVVSPVRFIVMLAGVLTGEGSPLFWAATHRLHHQRSDQEGDPHSPTLGAMWSHLTWLFAGRTSAQKQALFERYAPDLMKDPMIMFFEYTYGYWLIASGVALYALGEYVSPGSGLPFLLWGLCVRMIGMYHSTWFVNSATHIWGYRNYDTRDLSRNLWWVAVVSYGEGWHNNHHAHPSVAPAGHKWWELDVTWWSIKTLRALGLAYDVKDKLPQSRAAAEGC